MTTAIEDKELNQELQELLFIGKNWLSELELLEKDISVLQKSYTRSFLSVVEVNGYEEADDVLLVFDKVEGIIQEVRSEAQIHLTFINRLVEHSNSDYNLSLVENHIKIEVKLKDLLRAFNALRQMVSKLTLTTAGV